jgi:battenin
LNSSPFFFIKLRIILPKWELLKFQRNQRNLRVESHVCVFLYRNVISAWSSGTGGAGIFGSLFYLALTTWLHVSPFVTLMIASVFPLFMVASYFLIMTPRQVIESPSSGASSSESDGESSQPVQDGETVPLEPTDTTNSINQEPTDEEFRALTFLTRLRLIVPLLLRYMLPLILVYYAEYLINQGVTPGLKFPGSFADGREYVYYQFLYQSGVFLSRSSVNLFQIPWLWIFPGLQVSTLIFLFCQAYFKFIPSIWVVFGIIGSCSLFSLYFAVLCLTHVSSKTYSIRGTARWRLLRKRVLFALLQ